MTDQDLKRLLQESTADIHFTRDMNAALHAYTPGVGLKVQKKLIAIIAMILVLGTSIAIAETNTFGIMDFLGLRSAQTLLDENPGSIEWDVPFVCKNANGYELSLTEGIYDGHAYYAILHVTAQAQEDCLLVPAPYDIDSMPIESLFSPYGPHPYSDHEAWSSIREWAEKHGKTIKYISLDCLNGHSNRNSFMLEDEKTMAVLLSGIPADIPSALMLEIVMTAYTHGCEHREATIRARCLLTKKSDQWTQMTFIGQEIPQSGLMLDAVFLYGTPMATYIDIVYHATDMSLYHQSGKSLALTLVDESGQSLCSGTVGTATQLVDESHFVQHASLSAMDKPLLSQLRIQPYNIYRNTPGVSYDMITIDLTEE